MKATAIIALLLCFAFVLSLALTGCGKNKEVEVPDDGRGDLSSGQQDIVPPPVGDENGDEIEDNSSNPATPQKPGSSSQKPSSSAPSSSSKPATSSNSGIGTSRPDGAIDIIV